MARRLRVLQVGPIPPPIEGGIAAYMDGLLRSSVAEEFELVPFDVRVPERARRMRPLRGWTSVQFLRNYRRALRETTPDIVHIHSSAFLSFWEKSTMGRMAHRQGIPWVLHLHDGFFESFLGNLRNPLARLARANMQSASAVITVCEAWCDWLNEWVEPEKIRYLPNAIRAQDFPQAFSSRDTPRLLFLGDLSESKGIYDLCDALGDLHSSGLDFEVDLVGGAASAATLQEVHRRFAGRNLSGRCTFHGPIYNEGRNRLLEQAAIFVLPSHTESFCLANLEAMACGLPVISTRTGAIPEVVREGREGLLVTPRDVEGLKGALATLILDPQKRSAMGQAARLRAQRFDWSVVVEKLAALYDEVGRSTQEDARARPSVSALTNSDSKQRQSAAVPL